MKAIIAETGPNKENRVTFVFTAVELSCTQHPYGLGSVPGLNR